MRRIEQPESEWEVVAQEVGWANHSVTRMWRGHELALFEYHAAICGEWTNRGYRDTCLRKVEFLFKVQDRDPLESFDKPPWLGDERLHGSHRSNLLRKDPEHYGRFGWLDDPDEPYYWPAP